jgi:hypothetical protein
MKKLFLLLFAIALGSATMAQIINGTNGGHNGHGGHGNDTEGNEAYIGQVGYDGTHQGRNDAYINQTGAEDAKAFIYQNGYHNDAYIGQKGKGNVAGGGVWDCMSLCCPHLEFGVCQDGDDFSDCFDVRDIELLCKDVRTPKVHLRLPFVGYGIVQIGLYNTASIEQCGEYNRAGIKQDGAGLNAQIRQSGHANTGLIWMRSEGILVKGEVVQVQKGTGDLAYTALNTKGFLNKSEALIIQDNTKKNVAIQKASGSWLKLGISQNSEFGSRCETGKYNEAVQLVEGYCLSAFIEQKGDDNKAIELVAGKNNWAGISQWGDNNHAMIKQGDPFKHRGRRGGNGID